jgi:hypothetical protein
VREALNLVRGSPSVFFVYCSVFMLVILGAAVFVLYVPIIQSAKDLGSGLGLGTKGVGFVAAIGSVGLVVSSMGYGLLGHKLKKHVVMLTSFLLLGLVAAGLAVSRSFAPVAPLAGQMARAPSAPPAPMQSQHSPSVPAPPPRRSPSGSPETPPPNCSPCAIPPCSSCRIRKGIPRRLG